AVKATEMLLGASDGSFPLIGFGHIEVHVDRVLTEFGRDCRALLIEDIADHHLAAVLDDRTGECLSESAGTTGDEDYLVFKLHDVPSFMSGTGSPRRGILNI